MAKREPIRNRRSPTRERHETSLVTLLGRGINENQLFRPPSAALFPDIAQREPAIFVQLGPVGGQAIQQAFLSQFYVGTKFHGIRDALRGDVLQCTGKRPDPIASTVDGIDAIG